MNVSEGRFRICLDRKTGSFPFRFTIKQFYYFFNVVPLMSRHLFNYLLWSVFQSSYITHITNTVQLVHRPTLWWYSNLNELNFLFSQKLIKLSPLPGFEPKTSPVASRRANLWTMTTWFQLFVVIAFHLIWIWIQNLVKLSYVNDHKKPKNFV